MTAFDESAAALGLLLPDDWIYLDHAATTPVEPEVVAAMAPYWTEHFGNPASIYQLGQDGRAALDRARVTVARVLRCQPTEILFTSGATESANLALTGVALRHLMDNGAAHVITTGIEHHAVLHTADWLSQLGIDVTIVPPDSFGLIDPDAIRQAIRPETCLVSVMYVNNETGAIQPINAIGAIAQEAGVLMHTDAVQAAGLLPLAVDELHVDLLGLSAHKFYGPKGVGLLYIRRGTPLVYQQHGGGQESGRRGGTENVPGIVGLATALELADSNRDAYRLYCATLRDQLLAALIEHLPDIELNGPPPGDSRQPSNLNLSLSGVQGETLLLSLDMQGVAASAGSACTTGKTTPSHVLKAMGMSDERCRASIRLTVGRCNAPVHIDDAVEIIVDSVSRIRELAPLR